MPNIVFEDAALERAISGAAALPFGGCKQSGWGREMGAEALELYTETKAVCLQL